MDDRSLGIVLERLDEANPTEDVLCLVLAACQGPDEIARFLGDGDVESPQVPEVTGDGTPAVGYLTGMSVRGFRGIGETAQLELEPGPGLTLVVGRNGTGKSSFAEAIEMALTGTNQRWEGRSAEWKGDWRNLHVDGTTKIRVDLAVEGYPGTTEVTRTWQSDDDLDDSSITVQPQGQSATDLSFLSWDEALATFRPFLPYSELGSMLDDGPSALYDAMSAVLGLEALDSCREHLRQARLERQRERRDVLDVARELQEELEGVDEPRAQAVIDAMGADEPDLDAIEQVTSGTGSASEDLDVLRRLAELPRLDLQEIEHAADELRTAAEAAASLRGTDIDRARQIADLLERALSHHRDHGDTDCPVCGRGRLDRRWADATRKRIDELRSEASEADATRQRLRDAERRVNDNATSAPAVLEEAHALEIDTEMLTEAHATWAETISGAEDPDVRADALVAGALAVADARDQIRRAATAELEERQDRWRPYATRISGWLEDARPTIQEGAWIDRIQRAEEWFKETLDVERAERWAPIAQQARDVWETLRQRSHVELQEIELAGSTTRRRVELKVTVDGIDGAALGVMSQGELHALALSLFLPRATSSESPFRFLVIDDPVQSMDPAKVDGLARALHEVAQTRQVLVFTHDDRLPEAIRRLQLDATVLEVARDQGSAVSVRPASTPWERHLDDARALSLDDRMPREVVMRVAPSFCRMAVEAKCADVIRRRQIGRGDSHRDVEDRIHEAHTLMEQLSLALFDTSERGGEVYRRVNRWGNWAGDTVRACNEGAHGAYTGDITFLINDTERFLHQLENV